MDKEQMNMGKMKAIECTKYTGSKASMLKEAEKPFQRPIAIFIKVIKEFSYAEREHKKGKVIIVFSNYNKTRNA